ncbi:hypothetical protein F7R21_09055 [Burkholderia latens]|uniref:Uncharacterized protein n=1 Tax=Burkholderia latens TaxID=488446 RepID=A0A6H9T5J4_9BURK|nr:hypothetical protein F7R21_09055 [Burkholderia latens]
MRTDARPIDSNGFAAGTRAARRARASFGRSHRFGQRVFVPRHGDTATRRHGDTATRRHGDTATRRHGDTARRAVCPRRRPPPSHCAAPAHVIRPPRPLPRPSGSLETRPPAAAD